MRSLFWGKRLAVAGMALLLAAASAAPAFADVAPRLDKVEDTYWDEDTSTLAIWEGVEDADRYEVYLYCEDSKVAEIKTKKTQYNFRKKMTREGDYTFRVRALSESKKHRDGVWSDYSDTTYISESFAEAIREGDSLENRNPGPGVVGNQDQTSSSGNAVVLTGKWEKDDIGWWYRNADGSYQKNGWWQNPANGIWYFFNEQGYMVTGWIDWNGNWYYCEPANDAGNMVTGDYTIDGVNYRFNESGALEAG